MQTENTTQSPIADNLPMWVQVLLVVTILGAIIWFLTNHGYLGADFLIYRRTGVAFLEGKSQLYDPATYGFFNAPWILPFLIFVAVLPPFFGQALLTVSSILAILLSVHIIRKLHDAPPYVLLLIALNLHTVDLIVRGQIDSFMLLALVAGWWGVEKHQPHWLAIAFVVLSMKPINVALASLVLLWGIRQWSLRDIIAATWTVPAVLIGSGFIVGFDYPIRYIESYTASPTPSYLEVSLWRALDILALPSAPFIVIALCAVAGAAYLVYKEGVTMRTLSVAILVNLLFTPYAAGNHYVLLFIPLIYLSSLNLWWTLIAAALTWTPLTRLNGYEWAVVDLLHPAWMLLGILLLSTPESNETAPEKIPEET